MFSISWFVYSLSNMEGEEYQNYKVTVQTKEELMFGQSTHIVVGVQNPGDVLCQVSIQHSLDVTTNINCGITTV